MIVKSYGTVYWTDKFTGKENAKNGPLYIHFNEACLKRYNKEQFYAPDEQLDYSIITVDQKTLKDLNEEEKQFLLTLCVKF